jgi:hypothetical protein
MRCMGLFGPKLYVHTSTCALSSLEMSPVDPIAGTSLLVRWSTWSTAPGGHFRLGHPLVNDSVVGRRGFGAALRGYGSAIHSAARSQRRGLVPIEVKGLNRVYPRPGADLLVGCITGAVGVDRVRAATGTPALMVVEYEITDPAAFKEYIKSADAIHSSRVFLARHKGYRSSRRRT